MTPKETESIPDQDLNPELQILNPQSLPNNNLENNDEMFNITEEDDQDLDHEESEEFD